MKAIVLMIMINWTTGIVLAGPKSTELEQQERSFTIHLNAPVAEATPLFGPVREAEWAPGWTPEFLCPKDGRQSEGAVFTTKTSSDQRRIWLLMAYDEKEGRVEYVCVTPGITANQVKIRIVPEGPNQCRATITYRHSALTPEGNGEVEKLDDTWAEQQRSHWETAINTALRNQEKK